MLAQHASHWGHKFIGQEAVDEATHHHLSAAFSKVYPRLEFDVSEWSFCFLVYFQGSKYRILYTNTNKPIRRFVGVVLLEPVEGDEKGYQIASTSAAASPILVQFVRRSRLLNYYDKNGSWCSEEDNFESPVSAKEFERLMEACPGVEKGGFGWGLVAISSVALLLTLAYVARQHVWGPKTGSQ